VGFINVFVGGVFLLYIFAESSLFHTHPDILHNFVNERVVNQSMTLFSFALSKNRTSISDCCCIARQAGNASPTF